MNTNMLGHNQPPDEEDGGWEKKYFYMPMEEAETLVNLLEYLKKSVPEKFGRMHTLIDARLEFFERKMK